MAIRHVIGMGIGFSPGSVKYIPTLGFVADTGGNPDPGPTTQYRRQSGTSTALSRTADSSASFARQAGASGTYARTQ